VEFRRLEWAGSDLTAETFAQAWLGRDRFRDEHAGSALPWLFGIARNVLRETVRLDRVETRARERLGLPLDLAADEGYAKVEERLSPRLALAAALDGLPEHEREALELRVVGELSYDAVAGRLEIRPAAARLRVSRALRRLGAHNDQRGRGILGSELIGLADRALLEQPLAKRREGVIGDLRRPEQPPLMWRLRRRDSAP
jgi:RNA polymerase sigma factor (sigma-70 family)